MFVLLLLVVDSNFVPLVMMLLVCGRKLAIPFVVFSSYGLSFVSRDLSPLGLIT